MSEVSYDQFVRMASLANTLAKIVATLEHEQIVKAFLISQNVHNCIEYDFAENANELHEKMKWVFEELNNPTVFDPSIWRTIVDGEMTDACRKVYEEHRQRHELFRLLEIL